mmetsp:Transcript_45212/g.72821  ORF Transcript_45212/g.72821 Transcript_45212/m.72821 type:complete len:203 (+) Transcript_45212:122-730(+)
MPLLSMMMCPLHPHQHVGCFRPISCQSSTTQALLPKSKQARRYLTMWRVTLANISGFLPSTRPSSAESLALSSKSKKKDTTKTRMMAGVCTTNRRARRTKRGIRRFFWRRWETEKRERHFRWIYPSRKPSKLPTFGAAKTCLRKMQSYPRKGLESCLPETRAHGTASILLCAASSKSTRKLNTTFTSHQTNTRTRQDLYPVC